METVVNTRSARSSRISYERPARNGVAVLAWVLMLQPVLFFTMEGHANEVASGEAG